MHLDYGLANLLFQQFLLLLAFDEFAEEIRFVLDLFDDQANPGLAYAMLLGYMINWQQLYQDLMNDLNLLAQLNFILGPAFLSMRNGD